MPRQFLFIKRALQLTPENADAYLNFGITLSDQGRSAEAIICFQKAIQLKPDFAEANNHIGVYLWNQGKFDQAVFYFKRAIQIKPDYTSAYSHLVHLLQFICDWRQLNHFSEKLDELTAKALNNRKYPFRTALYLSFATFQFVSQFKCCKDMESLYFPAC